MKKPGDRIKEEARVYGIIARYGFPTSAEANKAAEWIKKQPDSVLARLEGELERGDWGHFDTEPRQYPRFLMETAWKAIVGKIKR